MASNNLQDRNPDDLVLLVNQMLTAIADLTPAALGLTAGQTNALQTAASGLSSANVALAQSRAETKSKTQDRDSKDATCTQVAATIARIVYANPGVTPAMIAQMGLAPRSTVRTKVVPKTPTGLVATTRPDGSVDLRWDRSGNPYGVTFLIESSTDGGPWTYLRTTTQAKASLPPYEPGVPVSFRISAEKNGAVSNLSPVSTIYPAPVAAPALRLAA